MKTRNMFVIDPLPNIAGRVKTKMESLSNAHFSVKYVGNPKTLDEIISNLIQRVKAGEDVGMVLPLNNNSRCSAGFP